MNQSKIHAIFYMVFIAATIGLLPTAGLALTLTVTDDSYVLLDVPNKIQIRNRIC